ncbi:MAG TPA: di-trans,poly-cis-decaprenylcistransferase [Firmicutes bacterium]|nr:di-trans,poly-cis-decaprenylcistransferase [Candidatus Fermentithermobacillaceae bacterium]
MDGNGRWAQRRGLPRTEGHRAGVESLRAVIPALINLGVPFATFYAFSTENWKRPSEEVHFLFDLLVQYSKEDRRELTERGVKLRAIGQVDELPAAVRAAIWELERETSRGTNLTVNVALNYGGRQEILRAVKDIARSFAAGEIDLEKLSEAEFAAYLYTAGQPDPDLIIRTSGEMRLSNFLPWQGTYSELYFTEVLWPEFRPVHLYKAVVDYAGRRRRFGGIEA